MSPATTEIWVPCTCTLLELDWALHRPRRRDAPGDFCGGPSATIQETDQSSQSWSTRWGLWILPLSLRAVERQDAISLSRPGPDPASGASLKNAVIIKKKTKQPPLQDRDGETEERSAKQYNTRQSSRRLLAQRAPRTLIYEIQDLVNNIDRNKSTDLDIEIYWERLCLQAEKLIRTSLQLRNRQRIMRILKGTKNLFYQMINKDGHVQEVYDYDESDCDANGYDGNCQSWDGIVLNWIC